MFHDAKCTSLVVKRTSLDVKYTSLVVKRKIHPEEKSFSPALGNFFSCYQKLFLPVRAKTG